jgi:hypothetical protein
VKTTGVEMVTEIFLYVAEENMIKVISIITTFISVFKGGKGRINIPNAIKSGSETKPRKN